MTPQQKAAQEAASFVETFNDVILFPTIFLLSAVAFLVFLWGCAQYVFGAANDQARQQGVKHITWGIIGLVVMLSAWAILEIAVETFGLKKELDCADNPIAAGCEKVFQLPGGTTPPTPPAPGGTTPPTPPAPGGTTPPTPKGP